MTAISLITDFGLKDNFVGVMKAVILGINPQARIVDICHGVAPQNILEAAFLLKTSFGYFPKGTLHLVVVDPKVGSERKKIIVKTKDYFFVAPDNGVLWPALKDEKPQAIIEITNQKYFLKPASNTFHGRDIFAPVAAYLSKREPINKFGKKINSINNLELPKIKTSCGSLTGQVIYIDRFGNLVSNIDKEMLHNFINGARFEICIKNKTIKKISDSYCESAEFKPAALIDSFNYLEIAVNCGSAKEYFGADEGDKVTIKRL